MNDMTCVCDLELLCEGEKIKEDIIKGKGLEVLLCIENGNNTCTKISQCLDMPIYSIKLYINRMLNAKIIKKSSVINEGYSESQYELFVDNVELMNVIKKERNVGDITDAAEHFSGMIKNAILSSGKNADEPNMIKAYFITANKARMQEFNQDIEGLFEKFKSLENLEDENTYQLYTVFAPFK